MTITINGDGTISGVSVGGLPDGIVDTDMLASNAVTSALLPAGSVLQVVQGTASTQVTTTSTTAIDTGLSVNITPSSSSSKILIHVTQHTYLNSDNGFAWKLLRDSTEIFYYWNVNHTQAAGNNYQFHPYVYLDSPATTSQITYKTQFFSRDNGELVGVHAENRPNSGTIVVMEIAA